MYKNNKEWIWVSVIVFIFLLIALAVWQSLKKEPPLPPATFIIEQTPPAPLPEPESPSPTFNSDKGK